MNMVIAIIGFAIFMLPEVLPLRGENALEVTTGCELVGMVLAIFALYLTFN
jgi:hypothetical protein